MRRRRVFAVLAPIGIGVVLALLLGTHRDAGASAYTAAKDGPGQEIKHDKSPALRTISPKHTSKEKVVRKEFRFPNRAGSGGHDPVVQASAPASGSPVVGTGFQGISANGSLPPDPNAAVGPDQIVEIVNQGFAVYSKAGAKLYPKSLPAADTNTLWTGFGGGCETQNDGDATVAYDRAANRWVIQQFSLEPYFYATGDYLECIAVSTTGDATGSWYRYAVNGFGDEFPDYPKLAVWPDGYYTTFNLFAGGLFYDGPEVCAYERDKMLAGDTASQLCQTVSNTDLNGLLPSDVDSSTAPPGGSPNYLLGLLAPAGSAPSVQMYKFKVDWTTTPASATLSGPKTVSGVPAFTLACGGSNCIAQKNTNQKLDSLGDRLMYRLAYRNFGDHESLVVTHSVSAGSFTGVRWYEIRDPGATTPAVYQSGTYAPSDSKYRWMGSAAMDKKGDIGLGYSVSNSTTFPSVAVTGRLATDALGTMTQGETVLKAGLGSQKSDTYCGPSDCALRWGDYSSMSVDPSDDCTFWYTNEYLPSSGNFNWTTWLGSFNLCNATSGGGGGTNDFSIAASPAAISIAKGKSGTVTISTALTSGSAQTVALSQSGKPSGVSLSFTPTSVVAGGTPSSSNMKITVGTKAVKGTYTITVTGTGTSATHTTPVVLTVKGTSTKG